MTTAVAGKKTIRDITDWEGKRALVRVDFNVPLDDAGNITNDTRIEESLPTIRYLLDHNAKVILTSHLGRPKGQVKPEFSLKPVADRLSQLLSAPVQFAEDIYTPSLDRQKLQTAVDRLKNGEVLLLENTRFDAGEEKNSADLAKTLAGVADVYVNDAFGAAHRAHASTEGVARHISRRVAGFLMEKEIAELSSVVRNPERPFTAIIGGSKVSSKITVLEQLIEKVDTLVIGGAMIFTFLKAQGHSVGKSMVEDEYLDTARDLLKKAEARGVKLILADDVVVANAFNANADTRSVKADQIPDGWMGLDVGPETVNRIRNVLDQTKTVLWNGPLGVFEMKPFAAGTRAVAEKIAELTQAGKLKSVLGGGDTVTAIEQFGIGNGRYTHVSTGGGASLEFIEGRELPGIAVLENA